MPPSIVKTGSCQAGVINVIQAQLRLAVEAIRLQGDRLSPRYQRAAAPQVISRRYIHREVSPREGPIKAHPASGFRRLHTILSSSFGWRIRKARIDEIRRGVNRSGHLQILL